MHLQEIAGTIVASWSKPMLKKRNIPKTSIAIIAAAVLGMCLSGCDGTESVEQEPYFIDVTAGGYFSCGVRNNGTAICWGENDRGQLDIPDEFQGQLKSISAGSKHACGLLKNGSIVCWGANDYNQAVGRAGRFTSVNSGGNRSCGITESTSRPVCWGQAISGPEPNIDLKFVQVETNPTEVCGITQGDGRIVCWAYGPAGLSAQVPSGDNYIHISGDHGWNRCGVKSNGTLDCRGSAMPPATPIPWDWEPTGSDYFMIAAETEHICALSRAGIVRCTGDLNDVAPSQSDRKEYRGGPFTMIDAGYNHTCALTAGGLIECWGSNVKGQTDSPSTIETNLPQYLYWIEGDRIRRSNLDGQDIVDLVTGLDSPNAMAINASLGKIYWTDEETHKIQRANLDGSAIEDVVTGLTYPQGIGLDVVSGYVYWSDVEQDKIRRANLDGTGITDIVTEELTDMKYPYNIVIDPAAGDVYWIDYLGFGDDAEGVIKRWSSAHFEFRSWSSDGVVSTLYSLGQYTPQGLDLLIPSPDDGEAINQRNMYWNDTLVVWHQGSSSHIPENMGTMRTAIALNYNVLSDPDDLALISNLNKPYCIALDIENGRIYYIEDNDIKRALLDGSLYGTMIYSSGSLESPRSIVIE
jgi:hypothetical protein